MYRIVSCTLRGPSKPPFEAFCETVFLRAQRKCIRKEQRKEKVFILCTVREDPEQCLYTMHS